MGVWRKNHWSFSPWGNLVGELKGADESVFETKGSPRDDKKMTDQYNLDRYRILHLVLHATPSSFRNCISHWVLHTTPHLTLTDYCHFENKCPS
ncbi:hypothetical protein CROQUDRAFT_658653 [Cronartium quercuum f. sp. fusiforme G11]|uniref:Uncharacterized protein n=1 Tax=Cronartium quercuum f. sp. fusiforme G11 TaxID=708437 RepID=A0A9P6NER9_9BASI|nr:hypothetical protein CROQUDRAFT_658653 [Cronartium quercuum f. sp. fusiforme G11]